MTMTGKKSKDELVMEDYLDELMDAGYVKDYVFEPHSFILSEPINGLRKHSYTPDYLVLWNVNALDVFIRQSGSKRSHLLVAHQMPDGNLVSFIEVKPRFDFNNMTRLATVNVKWVHETYRVYVNIVKPTADNGLLAKTFTPKKVFGQKITRGKNAGEFKYFKYWEPRTLKDYIISLQS